LPHEHRLIGMPAVFARWKGQIEVIRAFARVAPAFPGVHLVIAGGSIYDTDAERRYGAELRAAARQAGSPVHLLPFQPKIELVYPELDLVVHYSLRPEPFGRVVLEAMASGTPVIAAAQGGPVEILGGRESAGASESPARLTEDDLGGVQVLPAGWLVPPRRVAALAHTLGAALRLDPGELRAKGQAGRRRAEDHYSARHFARRVADVLRGVVLRAPLGGR
jgi:glycosyltransferase involved in cell wall biosynthesis